MSKRIIAFLLMLAMAVSCIPLNVFAAEAVEDNDTPETALIYAESTYCLPGKEVEVDICIANNPGIAGAKFSVSFDEKLTLKEVSEEGGVFEVLDYTAPSTLGNNCPFNWDSLDKVATEDGTMVTLTFIVADDAEVGEELDVSVSYNYGAIYDVDLNSIVVTMVGCVIDVIDYLPGDADGDGVVNGKDVTVIRRYNAEWEVEIDLRAADANGDGEVNGKDVTYIRRYNAEWDDYNPIPTPEVCNHQLTEIEAKEPNCTEAGNTAYWQCSLCDAYFSDAEAANEINFLDTVIVAKGHTEIIDKEVESSCSKTGLTEGKHCSVCNEVLVPQIEVPMIEHTPGTEATCTENQTCTVCGEILKSANGHVPGVEASCTDPQRCTVCQTVLAEAIGHSLNYVAEKDPIDANNPGNCAYWQCSVCKKCYLDETCIQEIALADTAWKTYLIYFFDLENDTYTVCAYKQSEVLSLKNITPVEMKGYDFNGWHTSENFSEENKISVIPAGNTKKIDLYANRSLHEYKITLLGLGREESWSYNIVNGIELTTPKWKESAGEGDCLIFSHWSDEKGNKITEISAGEAKDRTITANWIYKENYAISNKDKYTYVNGVIDQYGRYSFIYEIGAIKNIKLSEQHKYTFDALTEHTESETKTYTVGASEGKEVANTVSKIVSSSTEMANISRHTTSHTDGWQVGAKWKPEVEITGIKVSAWEFSGGYSNSDTDTYENTGFSSENNYEEDGTENEVRSTIDYYMEEAVSRTVSDTFIPGVTPIGNYTWARLMDVKVYAIVTYNPYTGNYVFDTYSVPTNIHNGLLYTLPTGLEYEINIVSGDILDFEIPFDDIPQMFYTVEYDANGGIGEMPKSVHELGVSSTLFGNLFEKTGYIFTGWTMSNSDFSSAMYTDKATVCDITDAGETVKLYAVWKPIESEVSFDTNGAANIVENIKVTYDGTYGTLPNVSREGYIFEGWYLDGELIESTSIVKTSNDHKLTAKWTPIIYTVSYNANGGQLGSMSSSVHTYDEAKQLSANAFGRYGQAFVGWSKTPNGGVDYCDQATVFNWTTENDATLTLYAVWVEVQKEVIKSGDTGERDVIVTDGGHFETACPNFNRNLLQAYGYKTITISVTFDARRINRSEAYLLRLEGYYTDLGSGSWHYSGSGWETFNLTITTSIDNFNDICGINLYWRATGSGDDDWTLGWTSIVFTANK